jgi:hypothetical protein
MNMSFINVNKVTLEDTNDGVQAFTNVTLLLASLTMDCVERNDTKLALHHLRGLRSSIDTLEYFLVEKFKENSNDLTKNKVKE